MASFSGIKNTLLAEQADEEVAPRPWPKPEKQQGPGAICSGALLSFFMEKNHAFPGCCGSSASAVTTMKRTVVCFP